MPVGMSIVGEATSQACIHPVTADVLRPAGLQPGPRLRVPDEKGGFSDGTASSVEGASPREEHDSTPQPANGGALSACHLRQ